MTSVTCPRNWEPTSTKRCGELPSDKAVGEEYVCDDLPGARKQQTNLGARNVLFEKRKKEVGWAEQKRKKKTLR